jgi:hypothetical protein
VIEAPLYKRSFKGKAKISDKAINCAEFTQSG